MHLHVVQTCGTSGEEVASVIEKLEFAEQVLTKQANMLDTLASKLESGTPPLLVADLLRQSAVLARESAKNVWQTGGKVQ